MNKNIVIVHYNTPYLTECLVRSINLFMKDAVIHIFDNSDKEPFTAKFDNVVVFDNTKGQIIDFDKWLENYPRRDKSNGRVNRWASAKHCYSVEKCMELIGESFFLLDSDILLKRDISELADETCIYVGETVFQPNSSIKRILPFLCYINVKMCRENNAHYFDHDYMHGLGYNKNNTDSDRYDTGAGFYKHAFMFNHRDIKLDDYIIHYGHGSWNKKGCKQTLTTNEWLERYKKFWSSERKNNVIYTCITGNYDGLIEPKYFTSGFDYICFTDNKELKSDIWDIRPLPEEINGLSQVKKQRYIKINAHKFLSEYDISIWVDGNVTVRGDLNKLINSVVKDECSIYVPKHPSRNCIYAEAKAVISMNKDKTDNVDPQINRYKTEGFPKDCGLLQSNIMIRRHNNEDCVRLMEAWSNEVMNGSHRDQLSFNYVCWKNEDISVMYLDKKIYESEWFSWGKGHKHNRLSRSTSGTSSHIIPGIGKKHVIKASENIEKRREEIKARIKTIRIKTYNVKIY